MAQGQLLTFDYYPYKAGKKLYNNTTDAFKYALITDAFSTVSKATVDPTLLSFTEAAAGGNYTAGGNALTTQSWTIVSGITKLDFDDVSLLKHASNPVGVKTLLIINSTATNDCYHAMDLTADGATAIDLVNNDLTITWHADGTHTVTVA